MFSLPISLPSQWEKRIVRYILGRFDFLEERTLGDLSNFEGSLGRNSVLTLKDVGIKRLKQLARLSIPPRLRIDEAVIGTLTITLPTNFLVSGSIEIAVSDVRAIVSLVPVAPPTPPPSPGKWDSTDPEDGGEGSEYEDEDHDLPATAEDLAQSFLHSQPLSEQDQLLHSLYQDSLAASSVTTSSSASEDDEEPELGIGTSIGLPTMLANIFKGIGDRLRVRIRGVTVALETTAPEHRGGDKISVEFEMEDMDVEGITNIAPADGAGISEMKAKRRKEGKRCITLENIRGYIVSDPSLFESPSPAEASAVLGTASELTERGIEQSIDTIIQSNSIHNMTASTSTIRTPTPQPYSKMASPSATQDSSNPSTHESRGKFVVGSGQDVQAGKGGGADGSLFPGSDMLAEDSSSDEELAFAPIHSTNKVRLPSRSSSQAPRTMPDEYDDEDSEDEGGAAFASGTLFVEQPRSPVHLPTASVQSFVSDLGPTAFQPDLYSSDRDGDSSGDDEMDAETSRLLSESTLFTHSEAGSLYLSATSGVLHDSPPSERNGEIDRRKDEEGEEEVGDEEIDARLDKLLSGGAGASISGVAASSPDAPTVGLAPEAEHQRVEKRLLRKQIFDLNTIEIFLPSLSEESGTPAEVPGSMAESTSSLRETSRLGDSSHPPIPGAFSMYASSRSSRFPDPKPATPPSSPPSPTPRKPAVRILGAHRSTHPRNHLSRETRPDIEVIVGNVDIATDVATAEILGMISETLCAAFTEEPVEEPKGKKQPATNKPDTSTDSGLCLEVMIGAIRLRVAQNLVGVCITENGEGDGVGSEGDTSEHLILGCVLRQIKASHKVLQKNVTTTKIDIKTFTLGNEKIDYLSFVQPPAIATTPRRRGSHPPPTTSSVPENDVTLIISQSPVKKRINVITLPLKVRLDLLSLEETLRAFGGFGGVIASTSASTATITKGRPPESPDGGSSVSEAPPIVHTKVDCKIGGLRVEVIGTTGTIGLEASPLKIRSETSDQSTVSLSMDKIAIYGPATPWDSPSVPIDANILVENTRVEFLGTPEQEDLGRLLELLTPSKDRYETDDDILIDTLLRQREQGSLLRIGVGAVKVEIGDVGVGERLKELGGEVMKVLTVTELVAQDERPGLLTLLNIDSLYGKVNLGLGIGLLEAHMRSIGVAHVSLPSLVALAVMQMNVRRNGEEELIGEGLERRIYDKGDEGKPMLMVRMVGDDPEPVIKLKFWNLRLEYRVGTLMSMMRAPENASAEALAQEMVQSIVHIAEEKALTVQGPPLGFDIVLKDCVLGLNPLGLKSRALVVLTDSRLQAALPNGGMLSAGFEVKKANLMVVDDVSNLAPPSERHGSRRRRESIDRHLVGYTAMGYVSVISVSSAMATLCVVEMGGAGGEKAVDLEIHDKLLLMESCADSTQTLIAIVNGLKPPLPEGEEVKYCTEAISVEMLQSLTEDAFVHPSRKRAGETPFHMDDEDGDMVGDDVPINLAFVESYYGHNAPSSTSGAPAHSKDELADSMLDEDLGMLAPGRSKPLGVGEKGMLASFAEQVHVLDNSPLSIVDDYVKQSELQRQASIASKRPTREAVNRWDSFRKRYVPSRGVDGMAQYFPLRVKIRDVHLIWNLHDGYDWQRTREAINQAVRDLENRALERKNRQVSFDTSDDDGSEIGDFLFNSIYIGVPNNKGPGDLASAISKNFDDHMSETSMGTSIPESRPSSHSRNTEFGGSHRGSGRHLRFGRSRSHKMQIELKGLCVDFLLFPPDMDETQSSIDLRVRDFEIFDNVPTSTWRKFVTYMQDAGVRETGSNMVHVEIMNVRPVPGLAASEIVLRATILPLRLHVDQDTLDFMTRFFEFKDDSIAPPASPAEIPFLQRVEVNSIRVKLDYKPKKVDYTGLRSGRTTEFMNFFILEEADMVLRHVVLFGISGFPRMGEELNATWMPDIRSHQLGDVLAGVAPVRSLVNLGSGMKDLVVVPMREYQKDGRIVRSLQKGAWKFAKTTTSELVRLGAKVAVGTQNMLQNAEGLFVPTILEDGTEGIEYLISDSEEEGDIGPSEHGQKKAISLYADQPLTLAQGLRGAGDSLRRNFGNARDAIMAVPVDIAEQGSAQGAAKAVARAAPVAIIRPMIGATEAVSRTLLGVTNALDPDQKRRVDDKYKKH
ncbi:unnamed protein product [Tuber aestivum]|uniref:Autophagy-related protein 2 n=1 Tax=Tuber aestivum TaxID=59557 RepID=A0A292Q8S8_9PEZI|nr:unnamed protein product [Tuber aestivum]